MHFVKTQQIERRMTQVKGYLEEMLACVHHSYQAKKTLTYSFRCLKLCAVSPYVVFIA